MGLWEQTEEAQEIAREQRAYEFQIKKNSMASLISKGISIKRVAELHDATEGEVQLIVHGRSYMGPLRV